MSFKSKNFFIVFSNSIESARILDWSINKSLCAICKKPMHAEEVSVDRINNLKPHEKSNCRLVHKLCHVHLPRK